MKILTIALAIAALVPAQRALAYDVDCPSVNWKGCDSPARWAPRQDSRDARYIITTESGDVSLLLTDRSVAVQLSDRVMRKLDRKLKAERDDDEDNVLARAFKAAVISSVRSVLDHSSACRIRDLNDVEYTHGRLVFTTEDGDRIFENLDVNDQDVMSAFAERDARAFVREFRSHKVRLP